MKGHTGAGRHKWIGVTCCVVDPAGGLLHSVGRKEFIPELVTSLVKKAATELDTFSM